LEVDVQQGTSPDEKLQVASKADSYSLEKNIVEKFVKG
jgi:hypothetical protein